MARFKVQNLQRIGGVIHSREVELIAEGGRVSPYFVITPDGRFSIAMAMCATCVRFDVLLK